MSQEIELKAPKPIQGLKKIKNIKSNENIKSKMTNFVRPHKNGSFNTIPQSVKELKNIVLNLCPCKEIKQIEDDFNEFSAKSEILSILKSKSANIGNNIKMSQEAFDLVSGFDENICENKEFITNFETIEKGSSPARSKNPIYKNFIYFDFEKVNKCESKDLNQEQHVDCVYINEQIVYNSSR
jgi:hypothetical protein